MTVTIREVAQKLNISITTVSRALDGYDDVSDETRRLVVDTAQQMGYVPNRAARQLRRQRADTIGYILPTETPRFSNPFFAEFVAGLGDEAAANNYDLLVSTAPPKSAAEQEIYARWVHGRKVDGMVLNRLRQRDWRVQYLAQNVFPLVTLQRSLDPLEYPSVEVDGRRWFRALVEHLYSLGRRRIAYVGAAADLVIQTERFQGYQDGLAALGLALDAALVVEGDLTPEGGYRAAQALLNRPVPPDAVACVDDITAMGVLHAAHEMGCVVGKNLAVTGFDGVIGFEHTHPPLTTVNQPVYQIARQMAQMLLAQIAGRPLKPRQVQIEPVLELNASTLGAQK